jgi:hypothetical protein
MIWFKRGFKPCAALALSLGAAALLTPDLALADAGACVTFHASGQRGMRSGALRQAAKDFTACGSDESCPAAVRNECVTEYVAVRRRQRDALEVPWKRSAPIRTSRVHRRADRAYSAQSFFSVGGHEVSITAEGVNRRAGR